MSLPVGLALAAFALQALARLGGARQTSLSAGDSDPAAERRLVICNAYPSNSSVTVTRNQDEAIVDKDRPIPFKECRRTSSRLAPHDIFAFTLAGVDVRRGDVKGSFEIGGPLPDGATFLLVFEKRNTSSPLPSFQSFTFQPSGRGINAQLAVIDTYKDGGVTPSVLSPILVMTRRAYPGRDGSVTRQAGDSLPHRTYLASLRWLVQRSVGRIWPRRDQPHASAQATPAAEVIPQRVQELNFGRVYALQRGGYEAAVVERAGDVFLEGAGDGAAKVPFAARDGQLSVVLRVGDGGRFGQSLVAFHATIDDEYVCSPKTEVFCGFGGLLSPCQEEGRGETECKDGVCQCKEGYCADGHGRCLSKVKAKELPQTYKIEVVSKPGNFLYFRGESDVSQTVGFWEGDPGSRGEWRVLVNNDNNTVMLYTKNWGTDYWLSVEQQNLLLNPGAPEYQAAWTTFTSPQSCSFEVHSPSDENSETMIYLKDVRSGRWIDEQGGVMIGTTYLDAENAKLRFHPPLTDLDIQILKDGARRAWLLVPLLASMRLLVL